MTTPMPAGPETVADELAVEVGQILDRLPRTRITPETITQSIIDNWYRREERYRAERDALAAEVEWLRERVAELEAKVERARHEGIAAGLDIAALPSASVCDACRHSGRSHETGRCSALIECGNRIVHCECTATPTGGAA